MACSHHNSSRLSPHLCFLRPSRVIHSLHNPNLLPRFPSAAPSRNLRRRSLRSTRHVAVCCSELSRDRVGDEKLNERTPFDLNLAVLLAGFAFEAYMSPASDAGRREVDGSGCQTAILSEQFLHEIYDGQLLIKLKKGLDFPAMDPWGTSDPYVILQLEGQVAKSSTKWATKEPTWNEDLTLNINRSTAKLLQIAAWDANLVTPHKRMGNAGIDLISLCDGNLHELVVELEGIGGGGKITLEVKYKSFDAIDKEKQWWKIPVLSDLILQNNLGSSLEFVLGSERINVSQFVEFAFGQLSLFNLRPEQKDISVVSPTTEAEVSRESIEGELQEVDQLASKSDMKVHWPGVFLASKYDNANETTSKKNDEDHEWYGYFWDNLAGAISQTVTQKLGFSLPIPKLSRWDVYNLFSESSMLSQKGAEEGYVQSGLATPEIARSSISDSVYDSVKGSSSSDGTYPSQFDIKKAASEIFSQTETILGALMVLTTMFSQQNKVMPSTSVSTDRSNIPGNGGIITKLNETSDHTPENSEFNELYANDMKKLFSTAESAMEAWAMLSTSLGRASFIKSEFQKICFLDNDATDTQVAIWRDLARKRLVVAFRGTEQARWKDLRTDLMLVPSGLNPERLGGSFKDEVQVHGGFLSAYDSVRNRIMALINSSISLFNGDSESKMKWHVYVTGHSLGGALATLLALELSSSQLAKYNLITVTMYNFGSPRVGNRSFADVYNQKVNDSWRVVNHRDIIPTVPRLMGYCHVAQPVYLTVADLKNAMVNLELSEDGYDGDIIGEYTPDVLVNEFMKGEKELIDKILEAEINLFRSLRDGSALMQHMEDFYYIALLQNVKSKYRQSPP